MTNRIRHISSMLERYPIAHRVARNAYRVATRPYYAAYRAVDTAQALARRRYQIRSILGAQEISQASKLEQVLISLMAG
jgi:hypothetical protein